MENLSELTNSIVTGSLQPKTVIIKRKRSVNGKIKTMRYLGNKTDMLPWIYDVISAIVVKNNLKSTLFDGFGGTGCVSQYFNQKGYSLVSNDITKYAYMICYSRTKIHLNDLQFNGLNCSNIRDVFSILNNCKHKGFVYYNYSPNTELEHNRKYFTNENAEIIDGIRVKIEEWKQSESITENEYIHLIAVLIETVSLYSNIPGTYGAFLNTWDTRALKRLSLSDTIHTNLLCKSTKSVGNQVFQGDLRTVICDINTDVLYIDPPYNERDYSAYYHVLETISAYDNPELKNNKTGTKVVSNKSAWCSKKTAVTELAYIIHHSKSRLIVLSYNNEGIIKIDQIRELFEKYGSYSCQRKQVRRFKCNSSEQDVIVYEYLHILERIEQPPVFIKKHLVDIKSHITTSGILYNSCCLTGMDAITDTSVDLICCDLPYGLTECKWDTPIDIDLLWKCYNRILKPYGTIILFGQQPFTSRLVASNYNMFKYSLVWQKSKPGGFAQAPYKVLCEHEDILIFTFGKTTKNALHRMVYNPQGTIPCNIEMKGKTGNTEHRKGRTTQRDYVQTVTNYPRSILKFNNEGSVKHATQKPIKLIEYLVNTFSNANDVVLDNCMGSGTTAIACLNTNRRYVGFEKNETFFDICVDRISNHLKST